MTTQTIGSRRQVWNGTAKRTSGGLTKGDLMMSHGRIVSKSKHFSAKKEMRLLKYGYGTQKGKFGFVKIGTKKHRKGHKKMRGGMHALSPANVGSSLTIDLGTDNLSGTKVSGAGITDFGSGSTDVQMRAAMAGGRRRRHSRSHSRGMAGGSGAKPLDEPGLANWSGDNLSGSGISGAGITDFGSGSTDVQMRAAMAGGSRRRRRHRKYGKMRGGTTSHRLSPANFDGGDPLNRALGA
jgi:hypothetical protein